jgi:hypothetical protein
MVVVGTLGELMAHRYGIIVMMLQVGEEVLELVFLSFLSGTQS